MANEYLNVTPSSIGSKTAFSIALFNKSITGPMNTLITPLIICVNTKMKNTQYANRKGKELLLPTRAYDILLG